MVLDWFDPDSFLLELNKNRCRMFGDLETREKKFHVSVPRRSGLNDIINALRAQESSKIHQILM